MLLHEVDAIQVLLRARDVVIFIPEDVRRIPVAVEVREVGRDQHEPEEEEGRAIEERSQ